MVLLCDNKIFPASVKDIFYQFDRKVAFLLHALMHVFVDLEKAVKYLISVAFVKCNSFETAKKYSSCRNSIESPQV